MRRLIMTYLHCCFLLFPICLLAQETYISSAFGVISEQEWRINHCAFQPDVDAITLLKSGTIFFEDNLVYTKIHQRIKILQEEGSSLTYLSIPYYSFDKEEQISGIEAKAYEYVNGAQLITTAENIEKKRIDDRWSALTITFPPLYKGMIIEFEYTLVSKNYFAPIQWYFQGEYPTLLSLLRFKEDDNRNYLLLGKGEAFRAKYPQIELSKKNIWALENLVGLSPPPYNYSTKEYMNQLQFHLYAQKVPNLGWQKNIPSWNSMAKSIYRSNFKDVYKKAAQHWSDYEEEISPPASDRALVNTIFNQLQGDYLWDGYYGIRIYNSSQIKQFEQRKKGKSGLLNLWLIGMLKAAGVQANAVLVSTRSHGQPMENIPLVTTFNHLICEVECDGQTFFLDLANKKGKLPMDRLPLESLVQKGFRVTPYSGTWINISAPLPSTLAHDIRLDYASASGVSTLTTEGYFSQKKAHQTNFILPPLSTDNFAFSLQNWFGDEILSFPAEKRYLPIELPFPYTVNKHIELVLPANYSLVDWPSPIQITLPNKAMYFQYTIQQNGASVSIDINYTVSAIHLDKATYVALVDFHQQIGRLLKQPFVFERNF